MPPSHIYLKKGLDSAVSGKSLPAVFNVNTGTMNYEAMSRVAILRDAKNRKDAPAFRKAKQGFLRYLVAQQEEGLLCQFGPNENGGRGEIMPPGPHDLFHWLPTMVAWETCFNDPAIVDACEWQVGSYLAMLDALNVDGLCASPGTRAKDEADKSNKSKADQWETVVGEQMLDALQPRPHRNTGPEDSPGSRLAGMLARDPDLRGRLLAFRPEDVPTMAPIFKTELHGGGYLAHFDYHDDRLRRLGGRDTLSAVILRPGMDKPDTFFDWRPLPEDLDFAGPVRQLGRLVVNPKLGRDEHETARA